MDSDGIKGLSDGEKRQQHENRLELAMEAAGLDFWENNPVTGEITHKAMKVFAELGYSEEEAVSCLDDLPSVVHPHDIDRVMNTIKDHFNGKTEKYSCEFRTKAKDGRWVWLANYGKLMRANTGIKEQFFTGVTLNVDQRRREEESLRNLAFALDGAGEAVMITDADGVISYVNRTFTAITGYDTGEVIGNNPRMLQSGRQNPVFYQDMWREINTTGEWKGELWNKRKNGEDFPQRLHIKSLKDHDQHVTSYIANFSDMTEEKHKEMLLLQAQKMETVGSLVAGVAHNFNNMLAGITGNVYLAQESTNNPEVLGFLKNVEDVAFDAAVIVKQLLSYSHYSVEKKKVISIITLIKDAVAIARLGISEDILLSTDFTDEELSVYCDATEIKQVILNMINNARDALEHRDVKHIRIHVERKPWLGCERNTHCRVCSSDVAHIRIEDTGVGIEPHHLLKVFDPFFTQKEVGEGTGLGLSMAKGTIESHGGEIHVSSTLNEGTVFEICLPLSLKPPKKGLRKGEAMRAENHETLLIVDDEVVVLTTLKDILLSLGYQVLTAANGADAVLLFLEHKDEVDLVISDVVMPIMDGPTAIKKMLKINPEQAVMFITGYENDQRAYIDNILTVSKPFQPVLLSQQVYKMLHNEKVE